MARKRKDGRFKSAKQVQRSQRRAAFNISRTVTQKEEHELFSFLHDHGSYISSRSNETPDFCIEEEVSGETGWREGRRVVELGILADGLAGCKKCGLPLSLTHTKDISTFGLGSVLKVQCLNSSCGHLNNIATGKRHGRVWDVNTKLATALFHAGLGERQINSILSALNIPPVSHTTIDRRQQECGRAVEVVAEQAVEEAIHQEVSHTEQTKGESEMTVSVDGAWQKRGSGRSYDSLSGHCSMIGCETGKVVGYSVRSKTCRQCDSSSPPSHQCRKNWTGSAKAMEPDMVIEMLSQTRASGAVVGTIVGDDDSTTLPRLVKAGEKVQKVSDANHVRKSVGNALYSLQKQYSSLTTRVIRYIQKCFNYMVVQNRGNPDGIVKGLRAVASHPFGDHRLCDEKWCRMCKQPTTKHQSLPYGRPLQDKALQQALADLMESYSKHSQKLSMLGSTQANESFNRTVASKAPKANHYSGSASLNFRVAACVAQKNMGQRYLIAVNKQLGLSPGQNTHRLSVLRDIQNRKKRAIRLTRKAKLKRLELKAKRQSKRVSSEIREGTSYSTAVDLQTTPVPTHVIDSIPPPVSRPLVQPVSFDKTTDIFFDLEATGLARTSHVTQLAAVRGEEKFCSYILPKVPITPKASEITGITVRNGKMFHNNKPVKAYALHEALCSFNEFLALSENNILVGHNIKTYDCPVLMHCLKSCEDSIIHQFTSNVKGFVDTRNLFKLVYPGQSSYSQESLVKSILDEGYSAHDALEDVLALQKLVTTCNAVNVANKKRASFSVQYMLDAHEHSLRVRHNMPSLTGMVDQKIISKGMAQTIAGSGLCFDHLLLAYKRSGKQGIEDLFTESNENKKTRVTKSGKIIESVAVFISRTESVAQ